MESCVQAMSGSTSTKWTVCWRKWSMPTLSRPLSHFQFWSRYTRKPRNILRHLVWRKKWRSIMSNLVLLIIHVLSKHAFILKILIKHWRNSMLWFWMRYYQIRWRMKLWSKGVSTINISKMCSIWYHIHWIMGLGWRRRRKLWWSKYCWIIIRSFSLTIYLNCLKRKTSICSMN